MFPFSVTQQPGLKPQRQTTATLHEGNGYELISFDAEKLNVFAAEVYYCEPHWHSAPELICILSGEFSVTLGHTTFRVTAGSLLYINQDEIHSLEAQAPDSQLLTIQFAPNLFDEIHPAPQMDYTLDLSQPLCIADRKVMHSLVALVEHLIEVDAQPSFTRIALIYQLLGTLATVAEQRGNRQQVSIRKKDQKLVKYGIEFINQHFDDELTLATIAENAGASYHHFSRIFKKISGYNFIEYLTMIRINKAKQLLKDTQIPITDISYICGFSGHKQLIFAFNKYCRMTPTEFRKNYLTAINTAAEMQIMTDFRCLPLDRQVIKRLRHLEFKPADR
ncbi:AraC family transcriptional regulator [Klebsiella sp. BIGb0407]|uniref:helix-turn-helix transcriptional regulator n=1 Tax=Klebsiella sp. BIGb0407 TaxID=2940603 RepID=UPI00216A1556|nr:AraC family transcriptional regulator [Klebsiella sp. BIGb0407]MCS3429947.1 AraC-like DNA-binding protein/mannose-6-phosphate isomerase-like protein (cupin superfamily) [Klebsiella sp. BIGb0407]